MVSLLSTIWSKALRPALLSIIEEVYPLREVLVDTRNWLKGRMIERNRIRIPVTVASVVAGGVVGKMDLAWFLNSATKALFSQESQDESPSAAAKSSGSQEFTYTEMFFGMYVFGTAAALAIDYLFQGYSYSRYGESNYEYVALTDEQLKNLTVANNNLQFTPELAKQYHRIMVDYLKLQIEEGEKDAASYVQKALDKYFEGDATSAFEFNVALKALLYVRQAKNRDIQDYFDSGLRMLNPTIRQDNVSHVIQFVLVYEEFMEAYKEAEEARHRLQFAPEKMKLIISERLRKSYEASLAATRSNQMTTSHSAITLNSAVLDVVPEESDHLIQDEEQLSANPPRDDRLHEPRDSIELTSIRFHEEETEGGGEEKKTPESARSNESSESSPLTPSPTPVTGGEVIANRYSLHPGIVAAFEKRMRREEKQKNSRLTIDNFSALLNLKRSQLRPVTTNTSSEPVRGDLVLAKQKLRVAEGLNRLETVSPSQRVRKI